MRPTGEGTKIFTCLQPSRVRFVVEKTFPLTVLRDAALVDRNDYTDKHDLDLRSVGKD